VIPILGMTRWECPNCDTLDEFNVKPGQSRMHDCPGLKGLTAPMVPVGTKCKTEAIVWDDYVRNDDAVRHDGNGVPMSAVKVTREDGEDLAVFPASAIVRMEF
jgi:hypothetical protein